MRLRVVMPQVHRRGLRRPQPRGEPRDGAGGVFHLQLGRIGLPEIFHAHAQPAAHVADKRESRRAPPRRRKQPGALRIGAFLNRETVGIKLNELEVVPHRPVADHVAALLVHLLAVRHAAPVELRGINVVAAGVGDNPRRAGAADERLDRLGPESVALAGETHCIDAPTYSVHSL